MFHSIIFHLRAPLIGVSILTYRYSKETDVLFVREHGITRKASYEERGAAESDWYDADVDPTIALTSIVKKLGVCLERVVGPKLTAAMFDRLLAEIKTESSDWREAVEEPAFCFGVELGKRLCKLSSYAVFGMVDATQETEIADTISIVEALLTDCPPHQWFDEQDDEALLPIAAMARARWNLDHGLGLHPEGLALLGGVKLTRIRNMMSGSSPELPRDVTGLISNEPARAWLEHRDCFLPTISKSSSAEAGSPSALNVSPVFLPVARDGSMFGPEVSEEGGYHIGEKGQEIFFENFPAALSALQSMPVARWRRRNAEGDWEFVSAVEWRRVDGRRFKEMR